MTKITKVMINELKAKFDSYKDSAEQHEFVKLLIIDANFDATLKLIETDKTYIRNHQKNLNAMFRVVLKAIGEDYSEYEEVINQA